MPFSCDNFEHSHTQTTVKYIQRNSYTLPWPGHSLDDVFLLSPSWFSSTMLHLKLLCFSPSSLSLSISFPSPFFLFFCSQRRSLKLTDDCIADTRNTLDDRRSSLLSWPSRRQVWLCCTLNNIRYYQTASNSPSCKVLNSLLCRASNQLPLTGSRSTRILDSLRAKKRPTL